jgi:S1-C subfamily serine protease
VERIKGLRDVLHISVPNFFLANKLLAAIYHPENLKRENTAKRQFPKREKHVSLGTGWPVQGGYVVTNHHVIAGHKQIIILRRNGVKLNGTVAMDDRINDLVLIGVNDVHQLPPALPLAQESARVGAKVFTIGYPNPTLMGSEPKLTDGIINSLTGVGDDPRTYQISVPLQVGNSGGPLLNMRGEVVGITTFKLNAAEVFKWTGDLPQNVNYAVKVAYLKVLLASVSTKYKISILPARAGTLEELAARIEDSTLIVIAK